MVCDLSLEVWLGEFVCLFGFLGCGKLILFGVLVGYLWLSVGSVRVDGWSVEGFLL